LFLGGHFAPATTGHFESATGGHFAPAMGGQFTLKVGGHFHRFFHARLKRIKNLSSEIGVWIMLLRI